MSKFQNDENIMHEKSDFELISEFKAGNEEVFNVLVKRYQKKVYWIARKMLGNQEDADDVVQDVFVKVYKSLKDFRSESSFYTWLYRVTINFAITALRKRKIAEFLNFDDAFPVASKESNEELNPLNNLEKQELHNKLEAAINKLPNKQKQVFIFRYYHELPYEEISKIMKTSIGGLKANYFHALKNIKNFLDGEL